MPTLDRKHEHLATLRAIVRRMALGAVLLEGWSVLTAAALLVAAHDEARFAWLALFMAIAFWLLTSSLLWEHYLAPLFVLVAIEPAESAVIFRLVMTFAPSTL